jgi:hypothetical protein
MKKRLVMLLLVFVLALAACSPGASPSPSVAADQDPTATVASDPTDDLAQSTPTQAATPEAQAAVKTPVPMGEPMPGCQTISFNPTPEPTLQALFPPPGAEDWAQGLDTAAVTIIEYGDFQ